MGKGDKKTKKGKIFMGSFGVSRPRKASTGNGFIPKSERKSGAVDPNKAESKVKSELSDKKTTTKKVTSEKTVKKASTEKKEKAPSKKK